MKSVLLERNLNEPRAALALLTPALKAHPKYWKLLLMKAQIERQLEQVDAARVCKRNERIVVYAQIPGHTELCASA